MPLTLTCPFPQPATPGGPRRLRLRVVPQSLLKKGMSPAAGVRGGVAVRQAPPTLRKTSAAPGVFGWSLCAGFVDLLRETGVAWSEAAVCAWASIVRRWAVLHVLAWALRSIPACAGDPRNSGRHRSHGSGLSPRAAGDPKAGATSFAPD